MPASSRSSSLSSSLGTSLSSSRAPSAGALWSRPPPEEVHYVAVSAGGPRCNKLRKFTPKAPKERKLPPMSAADLAQEISVGLRHASRRSQHEGAYSSASGGDAEAARRPARSLRDGLPELWPPLAASGSLPMMAHGPAHPGTTPIARRGNPAGDARPPGGQPDRPPGRPSRCRSGVGSTAARSSSEALGRRRPGRL